MKPQDDFRNGDEVHDEDSEGEEALALEHELSLHDEAAPARALAALNALRKSRQHYDTVLVAAGAELPAHRAVLAAASPYLLQALAPPPAAAPTAYRVDDVDADALRDLVEFAYTGRLRVREPGAARRLYGAAWRLRMDAVRAHLAERLLRRLAPADCLELRALPDLAPRHLAALDAYIAQHFTEICASGALAALPLVRIEMLRETSTEGGDETALAVAEAALVWLRDQNIDVDLAELCSRSHLVYVDGAGALRDCGEMPEARGDAPELQEYRREAASRNRPPRRAAPRASPPDAERALPALQLGARAPRGDCTVIAACRIEGATRATRALLALRGRLAAARVCWRDVAGGGVRGGPLAPRRRAARAPGARPRGAGGGGAGRGAAGVRRLRPRARAARRGALRPRRQRVGGAARHARAARALPRRGAARPGVRHRRQRRPHRARHDGRVQRRQVAVRGAAAAGAVARGGGGGGGGGGRAGRRRAVRGGRLGRGAEPQARAALLRRRVAGRAGAGRGALAVRRGAVAGRAVGAGRLRRVALPGLHRDAAPGRERVGDGARAAHGAALRGRGRVARRAGGGGRLGRLRVAAPLRVAGAGAGAGPRARVARRALAAPPARRARPGGAARRAVRGGRLRRQGVPGVRGVPVRAGRRVDDAAERPGADGGPGAARLSRASPGLNAARLPRASPGLNAARLPRASPGPGAARLPGAGPGGGRAVTPRALLPTYRSL